MLQAFISYDANDVYLSFINNIEAAAVTPNEKNVAQQFNQLVPTLPDELVLLSALLVLPIPEAAAALNQLSGEQYSNFILATLYDSSRFNREFYRSCRDAIYPCVNICDTVTPWIRLGGSKGVQKSDRTTAGFHFSTIDMSAGMHSCLNNSWLLGGSLGYNADFIHPDLHGKPTLNTASAAIYSLFQVKRVFLLSDLIGARSWSDCKRPIQFGSIHRFAHSHPRISYGRFDLQIGLDVGSCPFHLQPYLEGSYELYHQQKIHEHGAESANLLISPITRGLMSNQLGLHFGTNRSKKLSLDFDLSWKHYYGRLRMSETTRFKDFGTPFVIQGPKHGADGAVGSLYFSNSIESSWGVYLGAEGELWKHWYDYDINGGVSYRW